LHAGPSKAPSHIWRVEAHPIVDDFQRHGETPGLLDGLRGHIIGDIIGGAIAGLIAGVVREFRTKGLGETVKSRVAKGPIEAITPDDVHNMLGADQRTAMAQKAGISVDDLKARLTEILPKASDTLTPDGAAAKD